MNLKDQFDLVVIGGGIAGVSAAVVSARKGLNVLLIEKTGAFGGAISNSLIYPFMKYKMKSGKLLSKKTAPALTDLTPLLILFEKI